jgi:SAM-dependent methyltransferase
MLASIANRFTTRVCKICDSRARGCGAVDFSKSCMENEGIVLPRVGEAVPYWRCKNCGFVFTDFCDLWTSDDFSTRIYNDDYIKVDPDFAGSRAAGNAATIVQDFRGRRKGLRLLDYGSGGGQMAALVNTQGLSADSYDPYFLNNTRPTETFDIVTCYEVMEHSPTPRATVQDMISFLKEDGIVLFSTFVMTPQIARLGLSWWYIGPRNGHVSIYTKDALARLFDPHGFTVRSFDENQHLAYRTLPSYARHLLDRPTY